MGILAFSRQIFRFDLTLNFHHILVLIQGEPDILQCGHFDDDPIILLNCVHLLVLHFVRVSFLWREIQIF